MIRLTEYHYDLPDERIARFPLAERDQSKLLVYRRGAIAHSRFDRVGDFLPSGSLLVFNNTKVIPARLPFQRPGGPNGPGALIELFLLEPVAPSGLLLEAMEATDTTTWVCLIGNRKRWKEQVGSWQLTVGTMAVTLRAELVDAEKSWVRFSWEPGQVSFAEILHAAGQIPLPPYLKREATDADRLRYQTVYAQPEGAVAAPTAGLHFTDRVLTDLRERGFGEEFLTLHVGAGTFQPVKVENALDHRMHGEQVIITRQNVERLLANLGRVVPVGTTSMRSLETLYWLGVQWHRAGGSPTGRTTPAPFHVGQFEPYQTDNPPPPAEALGAVLRRMNAEGQERLVGTTEIMIVPGYRFQLCNGLITNFHQPGSTLILLVAALLGSDWRRVYDEALARDYRFLSYGDSSLLLPFVAP